MSQAAPESLDALEGAHLLTHRAYQIETLPPEAMEGVQASVHPGDTPDTALGWGVGPQASPAPSAGCALLPARLALTRAICLHYAGLFGEVSNGGLSWLRGGLIYWQTCFEAPVMVAVLQITGRRTAVPPHIRGGFHSWGSGSPPWEDQVRAEPLNFALLPPSSPCTIQSVFIEHLLCGVTSPGSEDAMRDTKDRGLVICREKQTRSRCT